MADDNWSVPKFYFLYGTSETCFFILNFHVSTTYLWIFPIIYFVYLFSKYKWQLIFLGIFWNHVEQNTRCQLFIKYPRNSPVSKKLIKRQQYDEILWRMTLTRIVDLADIGTVYYDLRAHWIIFLHLTIYFERMNIYLWVSCSLRWMKQVFHIQINTKTQQKSARLLIFNE